MLAYRLSVGGVRPSARPIALARGLCRRTGPNSLPGLDIDTFYGRLLRRMPEGEVGEGCSRWCTRYVRQGRRAHAGLCVRELLGIQVSE